jgi:hypothetical protein
MAEKDRSNKNHPADRLSGELKDTVTSAFRQAIQEDTGRPLTDDEEMRLSEGIVVVDADIPQEEYEFNLVAELLGKGMCPEDAQVQAKKETAQVYED